MKRACIILNETAGHATGIKARLAPLVANYPCQFLAKRDGESGDAIEATFEIVPGALRIAVGPAAASWS